MICQHPPLASAGVTVCDPAEGGGGVGGLVLGSSTALTLACWSQRAFLQAASQLAGLGTEVALAQLPVNFALLACQNATDPCHPTLPFSQTWSGSLTYSGRKAA